jgi:hypothetical protein
MMRHLFLSGMALILAAGPALAALPPHFQRQAEIEAILAAVVETFGIANPIEGIVMTGDDAFEVTSATCSMAVTLVDEPASEGTMMVGPRQFSVEAGELVCD